jgi:hypothetical protein
MHLSKHLYHRERGLPVPRSPAPVYPRSAQEKMRRETMVHRVRHFRRDWLHDGKGLGHAIGYHGHTIGFGGFFGSQPTPPAPALPSTTVTRNPTPTPDSLAKASSDITSPTPTPDSLAKASPDITSPARSPTVSTSTITAAPDPGPSADASPAANVGGGLPSDPQGLSGPAVTGSAQGLGGSGSQPHTVSSGAAAAIVITLLLISVFLAITVLRRRAIAKRGDRQHRWWFTGARGESSSESSGELMSEEQRARVLSMRSSFGTSMDHSFDFWEFKDPPLGTATVQRPQAHALVNPDPSSLIGTVAAPPPAHVNEGTSHRNSAGSIRSIENPFLSTPSPSNDPAMSVRPFSPSESFAFPTPPNNSAPPSPVRVFPTDNNVIYSTGNLSMGVTHNNTRTTPEDPFHDQQAGIPDAAGFDKSARTQPGVVTIRRPFQPMLDDELPVTSGDVVHVIQSFDDGWVLARQLQGKCQGMSGFIPVDCLSEANQVFSPAKRVSSFFKDGPNGAVLQDGATAA